MIEVPLWYLALGILTIVCGMTLVFIGMSRIIAKKIIGELKNESSRR